MSYSTLLAQAKRLLARRSALFETDFLAEMQQAQIRLEEGPTLPSQLIVISPYETTGAGAEELTGFPPSDFIRFADDQALAYIDDDGNEKRARRLDSRNLLVSKRNAGIREGVIYWFWNPDTAGGTIEIAPALSRDTDFRWRYYAQQPVLTGANDNVWTTLFGQLTMSEAGKFLAASYRDKDALSIMTSIYNEQRRKMVFREASEQLDDDDMFMGDPN